MKWQNFGWGGAAVVALGMLGLPAAAQMNAPAPMQLLLRAAAKNEVKFEQARGNYIYRQDFSFYAFGRHHQPGGYYQVSTDITFTPSGHRYQKTVRGPVNALRIVRLTNQDFTDLRQVIPLVITPASLPQYEVRYIGAAWTRLRDSRGRPTGQRLQAEVFYLSPRMIWPGQRYFEGKIWVDPATLGIVRATGRPVPAIHRWVNGQEEENLFGQFTTFYARIDGHFWFPVYTQGDDWLGFRSGPVEIRETVQFRNYQRFGVSTSFQVVPSKP